MYGRRSSEPRAAALHELARYREEREARAGRAASLRRIQDSDESSDSCDESFVSARSHGSLGPHTSLPVSSSPAGDETEAHSHAAPTARQPVTPEPSQAGGAGPRSVSGEVCTGEALPSEDQNLAASLAGLSLAGSGLGSQGSERGAPQGSGAGCPKPMPATPPRTPPPATSVSPAAGASSEAEDLVTGRFRLRCVDREGEGGGRRTRPGRATIHQSRLPTIHTARPDPWCRGSLACTLYPHQREGVLWLWQLYETRKGGILADDMGLGKVGSQGWANFDAARVRLRAALVVRCKRSVVGDGQGAATGLTGWRAPTECAWPLAPGFGAP